jgi:hypothetical protein
MRWGDVVSDPRNEVPDCTPEEFVRRLEPYERVLVELKDALYEGSWERVLRDLRGRQAGQPYVYKLSQTISRDIAAIERMQAYERQQGVDLSRLLKQENR